MRRSRLPLKNFMPLPNTYLKR